MYPPEASQRYYQEDPVNDTIREVADWMYSGENKTAALHGVAAFLFAGVVGLPGLTWFQFAATLVIGGYGLRELSDLVDAWRHRDLTQERLTDGAKDWLAVPVGLMLAAGALAALGVL